MHVFGGMLIGVGLALAVLALVWWFIQAMRRSSADAPGLADIQISGGELVIVPRGAWAMMSLRRRLEVPIAQIAACAPDPDPRASHPITLRVGGTGLPGVRAGFMAGGGGRSWWLYRFGPNAVVIELRDAELEYLVVEVDDPRATVAMINVARTRS